MVLTVVNFRDFLVMLLVLSQFGVASALVIVRWICVCSWRCFCETIRRIRDCVMIATGCG